MVDTKSSLTSSLIFIVLVIGIGCTSCGSSSVMIKAPAFFIFGDSTVDVGNNNYINPENPASRPPYGQNGFFPGPTGRFSDGRIIVDFIAQYAKQPIIPPFLQPSVQLVNGVNFASGSGQVLPAATQGQIIHLRQQLKYFDEVESSLVKQLGRKQAKEVISAAVFFFSMGSNDYMGGYLDSPQVRGSYTVEEFVAMVTGNLTQAIQNLYTKGARKFAFLSLGPLGCLPALRAANPSPGGGCFEEASALAMAHNVAFNASLQKLGNELHGFKYCNSNFYSWFDERVNQPNRYGLKDGVNACCGSGPYNGNYNCGQTNEGGDPLYSLCEKPKDHIWWDAFHPNERMHEQLAKNMWDGPSSLVGPYKLKDLFLVSDRLNKARRNGEQH